MTHVEFGHPVYDPRIRFEIQPSTTPMCDAIRAITGMVEAFGRLPLSPEALRKVSDTAFELVEVSLCGLEFVVRERVADGATRAVDVGAGLSFAEGFASRLAALRASKSQEKGAVDDV